MSKFIHLSVQSEFSIGNSVIRHKDLFNKAFEYHQGAVAVTDINSMHATIKFYKKASASGIKPVIGAIVLVKIDNKSVLGRITVLAKNNNGYKNLMKLVSIANNNGVDKRYIVWDDFVNHCSDIIVLSGGIRGDIGIDLANNKMQTAMQTAKIYKELLHDNFYLEIQRFGFDKEQAFINNSLMLADSLQIPLVATNDACFLDATDWDMHNIRVCIDDGYDILSPHSVKNFSKEQYFKSSEQMLQLFADIPDAIANTVEIAKRCNVSISLDKSMLPDYPVPGSLTIEGFLEQAAFSGLEKRIVTLDIITNGWEGYEFNEAKEINRYNKQVYIDRLKLELKTIIDMGFAGYFLIVMDFIKWSKDNGIPVGPGRGSGAGSLVAYCLSITDLDPIRYDLLFERFLNPERVSMPDFDIDFCINGRDRVIEYVANRYGKEAVGQIATFGSMSARAVVRDVARAYGKPYSMGDRLSKLIPSELGITLKDAIEKEDNLRSYVNSNEEVEAVWSMSERLEGLVRNTGKHAGGVVIAPNKLTDFTPTMLDVETGSLVTQYDKDDVEQVGLIKFDFLGLRNLTIINAAVNKINHKKSATNEELLDISKIPLDDTRTFKLLQDAKTTAVFQLESSGMRDLVLRLKPDRLEDIIALVALFRPGPLESGMVGDYIDRKHGRSTISYPHPDFQHESLKDILESTYGIILYQEQVMQIAQTMAGYTLGGADLLRRAMGKKKPGEMSKERSRFIEGSEHNGINKELAGEIFSLVEKFAGYGFNKSHSAAYALISYQTAWLKSNYTAEFMSSVLSADMQNSEKIAFNIQECDNIGVRIIPPNINHSDIEFKVNDFGEIVYGLGAIKGLGENVLNYILQERDRNGFYKDIFDICLRLEKRLINRKTIDALIYSGSLDDIGMLDIELNFKRAILVQASEDAINIASQKRSDIESGLVDMFGDLSNINDVSGETENNYTKYLNTKPLSNKNRLALEKDSLGFYLSGHPFSEYASSLEQLNIKPLSNIISQKESQITAGLIVFYKTRRTKSGSKIHTIILEDEFTRIDAIAPHSLNDSIKVGQIVVVKGRVRQDEYSSGLSMRIDEISLFDDIRLDKISSLIIDIDSKHIQQAVDHIANIAHSSQGSVGINIRYDDPDKLVLINTNTSIKPTSDALDDLNFHSAILQTNLIYS